MNKQNQNRLDQILKEAHEAEQGAIEGAMIGCGISFGLFATLYAIGWLLGG